jgi:hypothetical protein
MDAGSIRASTYHGRALIKLTGRCNALRSLLNKYGSAVALQCDARVLAQHIASSCELICDVKTGIWNRVVQGASMLSPSNIKELLSKLLRTSDASFPKDRLGVLLTPLHALPLIGNKPVPKRS